MIPISVFYETIEQSVTMSEIIFTKTIELIDKKLGRGYAMKNPSVLTSTLQLNETIYRTTAAEPPHKK
jgi:hypothetical protein